MSHGWNREAFSAAQDLHIAAAVERELRRCRTISKPVCELIDFIVERTD